MCGICGVLDFDGSGVNTRDLKNMIGVLRHRGPDAEGFYCQGPVGLAHRRLSIIDLSTGDQPLFNEDKSICLVVNGEIYNFRSLRQSLEKQGHRFSTASDSEVILHLYEEKGEALLGDLRGMFAFALWDAKKRKLFAARDRLGQKPLVWWRKGRFFAFASEIQSLLKFSAVEKDIDPAALDMYLSLQYIPAPATIFQGIRKLPPAHYLLAEAGKVNIRRYWHLEAKENRKLSPADYSRELLERLTESVRIRLESDVPLGVFLSGGMDSSAIVALMAEKLKVPVKTFSVGFSEELYNELPYARMISKRFGTEHHELLVKPEAAKVITGLVRNFGEPFADYSCIPTYYISQFAASRVKVVLGGDGGDESFAGYYRYNAVRAAGWFDRLPRSAVGLLCGLVRALPAGSDMRDIRWQIKRFFRHLGSPEIERYLRWISSFNAGEKASLYRNAVAGTFNRGAAEKYFSDFYSGNKNRDFVSRTMEMDLSSYLPFDLLVKTDIASMANSLELRAPFLDHEFMEFAAGIPVDLKLRGMKNKYILKQAFSAILPDAVINRKKQGFGIPLGKWLRGELKDFMCQILLDDKTCRRGLFEKKYISEIVAEHNKEISDNGYKIWTLLMFELWCREVLDE